MKLFSNLSLMSMVFLISFVQCSSDQIDPSLVALHEVISQHHSQDKISDRLLPYDQSIIPSTEQLRNNNTQSIQSLSQKQSSHLPQSIRIPDPIIRALVTETIVNKEEMKIFLSQLATNQNTEKLNIDNGVDFNQSYYKLDSLGYDIVESMSNPILVNDKLFVAQVITSGIKDYLLAKPHQSTSLKVFQEAKSEESIRIWKPIFERNIK